MKQRSNIRFLPVVIVIMLIIALSAVLSVVAVYARYSTQITGDVGYQADISNELFLVEVSDDGDKYEFIPGSSWQTMGGEQYLTFTVSNSDINEQNMSTQDMSMRIRVFIPEELSDGDDGDSAAENSVSIGNLVFTLQIGDNPAIYSSKVDYLSPLTPMYHEKGINGWFYSFYEIFENEDGVIIEDEVVRQLEGGKISDLTVTLTVQNTEIDCSDFQIIVDRIK